MQTDMYWPFSSGHITSTNTSSSIQDIIHQWGMTVFSCFALSEEIYCCYSYCHLYVVHELEECMQPFIQVTQNTQLHRG